MSENDDLSAIYVIHAICPERTRRPREDSSGNVCPAPYPSELCAYKQDADQFRKAGWGFKRPAPGVVKVFNAPSLCVKDGRLLIDAGEIIVYFKDDVSEKTAQSILEENDCKVRKKLTRSLWFVKATYCTFESTRALRENDDVQFAEPNFVEAIDCL